MNTLIYNDTLIKINPEDMASLTDMWRAAGSPSGRRPCDWRRLPETANFQLSLGDTYKGVKITPLKVVLGPHGGTFAHYQIALAYAKYLSPEFHIWANEALKERMEEEVSTVEPTEDNWKHRSCNMECRTCMWFARKDVEAGNSITIGRCRKHAPTLEGFPVVFPADWCGDHKLNEEVLNKTN